MYNFRLCSSYSGHISLTPQTVILFMHFVGLDSEQHSVLTSWLCFMMPEVSEEDSKGSGLESFEGSLACAFGSRCWFGWWTQFFFVWSSHCGLSTSVWAFSRYGIWAPSTSIPEEQEQSKLCCLLSSISRSPALYFCRILCSEAVTVSWSDSHGRKESLDLDGEGQHTRST